MYFDMLANKANLFPKWILNSVITSGRFTRSLKDLRAKDIRTKKFREIAKLDRPPELRFLMHFEILSSNFL